MKKKRTWIFFVGLIVLCIALILPTPMFKQGPYNACRHLMNKSEGYGVWQYKGTSFSLLSATVAYSDGTNDAKCYTIGMGSIWFAYGEWQTLAMCAEDLEFYIECPRGYFGVSPYYEE
jgi:hypothetical protein